MSWQQLQTEGRVRTHQTSLAELSELRKVIARDLGDARIAGLSADRRFATAYNAVLQVAKMAIACSGYRVAGQGHHMTTFQAVRLALGAQADSLAAYFDSCRRKRNTVDYDLAGVTSETEVADLIREAEVFRSMVESFISQSFPQFAAPKS